VGVHVSLKHNALATVHRSVMLWDLSTSVFSSLTHLGWLEAPGALSHRLSQLGLPAMHSHSCLLWLLPGLVRLRSGLVPAFQEGRKRFVFRTGLNTTMGNMVRELLAPMRAMKSDPFLAVSTPSVIL